MISETLLAISMLLPSSVTVCATGCTYATLRDALRHVTDGAVVTLRGGEYREELPLVIDRPLTLRGENWPKIIGDGAHDLLFVSSRGVTIENLVLQDGGASYIHEIAAIRVEGVPDCAIRNNRLVNNAYGIYLANSQNCTISRNSVRGGAETESEFGNGIHSWSGSHHTIENNDISNHRDGIYIEFTNDSLIRGNWADGNIRYGLHFMSSHRNEYRGNRFEKNGAGVAVMYSRDIQMVGNSFSKNTGAAAYGLLLKDISAGVIQRNEFRGNTVGIYMEGTNRSKFLGNNFQDNGYGLRVFADCDDNQFRENNFLGNTFDVVTNSDRNPNLFETNYWSNYSGYDLNQDGIGDIPYRPVSLSSVLVEKFDSTYFLIKSPLFSILDYIEQAIPILIPESLKDVKPLMAPLPIHRVSE
ncbi:MAG: nitrous oxide reductase family maturation protein NosD [Deltaproteobacteria bacterium]|nr:nitrous oxide reductase family maturation protein NosD [Deltaproteobacteria bacterium]